MQDATNKARKMTTVARFAFSAGTSGAWAYAVQNASARKSQENNLIMVSLTIALFKHFYVIVV